VSSIRYLEGPPASAEVVIIGGGVIGAATAFYAARAGLNPVLIERRPALCTLTTPASTGAFRLQFDNLEELEVVRESVELFLNFEDATRQSIYDPKVRRQGYLWVTLDEERVSRQRNLVEQQHAWGLTDVELLDANELRSRFPYVARDALQARWRAEDGFLDPKALSMGMVAGARADVVVGCGAVGFDVDGSGLSAVRTERGAISTRTAVIACGPFSRMLAQTAGLDLPLTMVARQKIVFPRLADVPAGAPMIIDDDTGAHWRPYLEGAALLFTDPETAGGPPLEHVPVDDRNVFRLLSPDSDVSVARVAPFWRRVWERNADIWMVQTGQYTMTPDKRPLVGSTEVPGLFVNTGDSGHGVMSGPALGRRLADLISGGEAAAENPFRIDRAFVRRDVDVL